MDILFQSGRRLVVLLTMMLLAFTVQAKQLVIVAPQDSPLAKRVEVLLMQKMPDYKTSIWQGEEITPQAEPESETIFLLLGAQLLKEKDFLQQFSPYPVVSVFASKQQLSEVSNQLATSIYVEPPLTRQLLLAQQLFDRPSVGILTASKEEAKQVSETLGAAKNKKINIRSTNGKGINQPLYKLLKRSDVLLAPYNLDLYNSRNIKNILVTSYRQNKVVIGPSKAYLRAGAYASTYSNLLDVITALEETLKHYEINKTWPKADYNSHYRVKINTKVATSLGIDEKSETDILEQLKRLEKRKVK